VGNEGGVEVVAATEVGGVSFSDNEADLGGAEDFGLKIIDEKTFKGSHGGTPDGDVHVISVQGNACCATGLVCPDKARPVGINSQDALCSGFLYCPQCEFPKNGCEGEAEVAFPSPDVRNFCEQPVGKGRFVKGNALWYRGLSGAWSLAVLLGHHRNGLRVELRDEVTEYGRRSANIRRKIGGNEDHPTVLGGF